MPLALGGGAYTAANPAQRMTLRFDRSGVALAPRSRTRVDLSVRAAGYGNSLRALGQVTPPREGQPGRVLASRPQ